MRANSIMNKSKISVAGLLLMTALAFAVTPASPAALARVGVDRGVSWQVAALRKR